MIATAYEGEVSQRFFQFLKLYLYYPSSGLYGCPLAMTDGAAFLTKHLLSTTHPDDEELKQAMSHLTSRDPGQFWTSGQWMTERAGGSDVSAGTQTVARFVDGETYELSGTKWFTSAIDSEMTYTLGRVDGKLALFFAKVQNLDGSLNGIQMIRLKDKLGTRQLPTAELILDGM